MKDVISKEKIMMHVSIATKQDAIALAGKILLTAGHVTQDYIDKMFEREELMTTYIGNGVAIPHGTNESKEFIQSSGISIIQVPSGVDFGNGNIAYLIIGIAGIGDEHLDILSNIAIVCSEEDNVKKMMNASTKEEIIAFFEGEL